MTNRLDSIRQPRLFLLNMIEGYSIEQLNLVPAGFNNNMIWNLGHMVAAQQGISYVRGGVEKMYIEPEFRAAFTSGTKPERFYTMGDLQQIKDLLLPTLDQLELDLQTDMFKNYTPWVTRYGVAINNIDDAINFLPFHEGLHIGVISALRKLV